MTRCCQCLRTLYCKLSLPYHIYMLRHLFTVLIGLLTALYKTLLSIEKIIEVDVILLNVWKNLEHRERLSSINENRATTELSTDQMHHFDI